MLKIGTVLNLEPLHNERKEAYKCKVVEFDGQNIYIDYPININTDKTVFLIDGTQLKVSFVFNEQSVYVFETEVLGRMKKNIPMIQISYPGDDQLIKIQRRRFVRVDTLLDVAVLKGNHNYPTVTEDISAGGCAITVKDNMNIEQNDEVILLFVFPMQSGDYNYLEIEGKIIRVWEKEHKRIASIEFINLQDNHQQIIIRHCFEKQLALRKKGLTV